MQTSSSRFATRRAAAALAMLAGLSGCQTPVVVAPPQPASSAASDRNAEIARILDLRKRGVITDAQAMEIMSALVSGGAAVAVSAPAAAAPVAPPAPAAPVAPAPAASAVVPKAAEPAASPAPEKKRIPATGLRAC